MSSAWSRRHLLALRGLSPAELRALLYETRRFADNPEPALAGRTVALLFFEDSTRTRSSFSLAAQRLGASVVDLSGKMSSINKGETPADTARVLEAMGADVIVVRDRNAGMPGLLADAVACSVINAGDGKHEHPTQGLLDLYSLAEATDRLDSFDLSGLRVAIVGDIAHSRVARSATHGLTTLGARVTLVGPHTLAPRSLAGLAPNVEVSHDFDAVLPEADAVMMLRIQLERGTAIASAPDYRAGYGLTAERAERMKPDAVVMHPGPMNRGVEIDSPVADSDRSIVFRQVRAGVPVRMAALSLCATLPR